MTNIFICIAAFVCFFLYDWNEAYKGNKILHFSFGAGCLLWGIGNIGLIRNSWRAGGRVDSIQILWGLMSVLFFLLLIYTLFFALPLKETYVENSASLPPVCEEGVYGLCRHPGFLWYCMFYIFLALTFPQYELLIGSIVLCICNFLYICAEDRFFFPCMFSNYDGYRERVPFLVPTKNSMLKCCQYFKKERR